MISKKLLNKNIRSTRARRFRIVISNQIIKKDLYAKFIIGIYFNYGLKYLYQHYGVSHLDSYFPSGKQRKYLINKMVNFARKRTLTPHFNLKSADFSVQSVDKMLESLCVNFIAYRRKQYKARHYWLRKEISHYLKMHTCNLSGYGRISFKHSFNDIKSITFKQNHNCIRLINNYTLHIPYFKNIHTKQSLSYVKHKRITEVRIKVRRFGDYELQIITKFQKQKHLTRTQAHDIHGLDVNSKDDKFFDFSDGKVVTWPLNIKNKYLRADTKARCLQNYITIHNHGNDNSRKTRVVKKHLQKLKAKTTFMIDNWYSHIIHGFTHLYPVLAMEQLHSFTMRMSKRDKRYNMRKNTNHKLARMHPTRFKKMMEDIYEDVGCLLLEVNAAYTSKTCHNDDHINFNLKLQKEWWCKFCKKWINRDFNSTLNIRDWAVNPKEHALWKLHLKYPKKFPDVKLKDLVIAF